MNDFTTWVHVLLEDAPRDLALLWLALALWVVLILIRQSPTLVLRKTDEGRLEISRHALHRLLEACAEQLKGVVHARARVRRRGGKFHTLLQLKVRPNAKLDAIQGYLEQEIRDIFKDNLGLPDAAGTVDVTVTGIIPEQKDF
jgi:hypothetical protein